ncbi:MAG: hypothetical protein AVDCRST_MAG02-3818, partial [uncultured Rubrobacteraceae bacterium]
CTRSQGARCPRAAPGGGRAGSVPSRPRPESGVGVAARSWLR